MARKKKTSTAAGSSIGAKRVRLVSAAENDKDVFVQDSKRSRNKSVVADHVAEVEDSIIVADQRRICPILLVDALKGLNDQQRWAVHQLGFGSVLHLQIGTVPPRMVSWCSYKIEAVSCCIEVPNHALLRIIGDDVYLVFGFPRGPTQVEGQLRYKDNALAQEWAPMFNKSVYNIRPSDVVSRMVGEVDGGDWFKRLFLMLVECCLFETATDGYVKPRIMDILSDLSKIRDLDWCDHMVACLLKGHKKWVDSDLKKFNGPSVFLVLFYIDRLVYFRRTIPRVFPLLKGWTTKALRDIEKVGFGHGFVEEKFTPALTHKRSLPTVRENEKNIYSSRVGGQSICADPISAEAYTLQLLRTTKSMADSMSNLMTLIIDAPVPIRQDILFNNVVQTTSLLIGVTGASHNVPLM